MNKKIMIIVVIILLLSLNISFADDLNIDMNIQLGEDGLIHLNPDNQANGARSWDIAIQKYKVAIVGFAAIASVTMVLIFIKNFVSLGLNASNSTARAESLKGILITGIATAALGSVTLIAYLFYSIFRN